jgi:hypothetical protein
MNWNTFRRLGFLSFADLISWMPASVFFNMQYVKAQLMRLCAYSLTKANIYVNICLNSTIFL